MVAMLYLNKEIAVILVYLNAKNLLGNKIFMQISHVVSSIVRSIWPLIIGLRKIKNTLFLLIRNRFIYLKCYCFQCYLSLHIHLI